MVCFWGEKVVKSKTNTYAVDPCDEETLIWFDSLQWREGENSNMSCQLEGWGGTEAGKDQKDNAE